MLDLHQDWRVDYVVEQWMLGLVRTRMCTLAETHESVSYRWKQACEKKEYFGAYKRYVWRKNRWIRQRAGQESPRRLLNFAPAPSNPKPFNVDRFVSELRNGKIH